MEKTLIDQEITVSVDSVNVAGNLAVPEKAAGLIIFAHGSGSSRYSPRNNYVARELVDAGFGTLLMDLLTRQEDESYQNRFNIELLTNRLIAAVSWSRQHEYTHNLPLGLFGSSTGAAAALKATVMLGSEIKAVVSRGGRPDMASEILPQLEIPTLLIVGGEDSIVIQLNRDAFAEISGVKELAIVPGASHLFEEPGKLEEVSRLAIEWFKKYVH